MPDTYTSFVVGYGVFIVLVFGLTVFLLVKTQRLETQIKNLQNLSPK
jgi:hypothetical protein